MRETLDAGLSSQTHMSNAIKDRGVSYVQAAQDLGVHYLVLRVALDNGDNPDD
jgi:hypothetical protein